MKNKKIKLEEFKVKSFITNLSKGRDLTIKGGLTNATCSQDQTSPNCTGGTGGVTTTTIDTAGEGCFVNNNESVAFGCTN